MAYGACPRLAVCSAILLATCWGLPASDDATTEFRTNSSGWTPSSATATSRLAAEESRADTTASSATSWSAATPTFLGTSTTNNSSSPMIVATVSTAHSNVLTLAPVSLSGGVSTPVSINLHQSDMPSSPSIAPPTQTYATTPSYNTSSSQSLANGSSSTPTAFNGSSLSVTSTPVANGSTTLALTSVTLSSFTPTTFVSGSTYTGGGDPAVSPLSTSVASASSPWSSGTATEGAASSAPSSPTAASTASVAGSAPFSTVSTSASAPSRPPTSTQPPHPNGGSAAGTTHSNSPVRPAVATSNMKSATALHAQSSTLSKAVTSVSTGRPSSSATFASDDQTSHLTTSATLGSITPNIVTLNSATPSTVTLCPNSSVALCTATSGSVTTGIATPDTSSPGTSTPGTASESAANSGKANLSSITTITSTAATSSDGSSDVTAQPTGTKWADSSSPTSFAGLTSFVSVTQRTLINATPSRAAEASSEMPLPGKKPNNFSAFDKLSDLFGWRKPGQRRVRSLDCGCPLRGQNITSTLPINDTFPSVFAFAKAAYAYNESRYDEISIAPDDIVTELRPVSPGWMKGCLRGRRGVFPSSYTKVAKACPLAGQPFSFGEADDDALGLCDPPLIPIMPGTAPPSQVSSTYAFRFDENSTPKLKMEAVVEFDYTAQEVDELTIRKGDVISDIRTQPGGWWEGCLHGRRGMFPDNFVKIRDKTDSNTMQDIMANNEVQLRSGSGRKCKVLYSYQPANDDELELQLNDIIDILDEVEEGWWRGKLRNRVGVFPSNFVSEITEKQTNGGPGSRKTSATQPPSLTMLKKEENISSGVIIGETDSPASPTGPDSGNPNALDADLDAPILPPKPVKEICRVLYPYEAANEDELSLKEGDIITIITKEVQDKGWWKGELRGRMGVFPDNFVSIIPQEEVRKPDRPPTKVVQTTPSANKIKDPFVKPMNTSGIPTNKRTVENTSKPDEKPPPALSKKPALPPTAKKPQLRTTQQPVVTNVNKKISNEAGSSPEQRLNDLVDGTAGSKIPPTNIVTELDFDGVERAAMLTHPTASRAKAPRRRLPTQLNKDNDVSPGMMNGNGEHHDLSADNSLSSQTNEIERENGLQSSSPITVITTSSSTASNRNSKDWEKNKAPWVEELKMNQAAKKNQTAKPITSIPKFDQVRNKADIPDSPASPTTPEPVKTSAITFRQHSTSSLSNNIAGTPPSPAAVASRPQSVHGDVGPARFSTSPSTVSPISRPVSMYTPASTEKPPTVASPTPVSSATASSFVPMKQFLEVVEKVSKLEHHCEVLTRTVTELSLQVKEEREKRMQLQQEVEKLADLVTQV